MNDQVKHEIISYAVAGHRVTIDGKNKWLGLGNRSGLHDYLYTALNEKWEKSGARFVKMLNTLPVGTKIELSCFYNIDRDRGRWHVEKTITLA